MEDYSKWEAMAIENEYLPVDVLTIPNQLRPIAEEMARNGEPPFALTTMMQAMHADMLARQPHTVHYAAPRRAFNQASSTTFKQF